MPGIDTRAPERTETRSGSAGSPKRRPNSCSTSARAARASFLTRAAQPTPHLLELGTGLGGDGEARRHRYAEAGHLCETRALASEKLAHVRPTLSLPVPEGEDLALEPGRDPGLLLASRLAASPPSLPLLHLTSCRLPARRQSPSSSLLLMYASSPLSATRSCSMLSRSRTVTCESVSDSKSYVTQNGVPTSSCRR